MGDVIKINEYLAGKDLDKGYENFLSIIQKEVGIPNSFDELVRHTYFTLRLLEGHVNSFSIMTMLGIIPPEATADAYKQISIYLEKILADIKLQ